MITITRRFLHTSRASPAKFALDPNYKFKCGLEIHTQLKTKHKLFSLSRTSFNADPNTNISYFDCGLPGTQPKLNPEALYLALKAAVAFNCDIQPQSSFDRKHYFYPDQPLGYQITQHYHPLAKGGYLEINKQFDGIKEKSKIIEIEQIQIEQDTGKTNYRKFDKSIKIDLNRSNMPLVELVTKPDFEDLAQVNAFVRKYQALVKHLDICSGELETGAMRVDVNISVNNFPRVEIKNLKSHGDIQDALKFEYNRQVSAIKADERIVQETRGWTGKETISLRTKEDATDYRYVPDSELPQIYLDSSISTDIRNTFQELPEQILKKLTSLPYKLELKYAKFLIDNLGFLNYYYDLFTSVVTEASMPVKTVNNRFINEFMGAFTKVDLKIDLNAVSSRSLSELILKVCNNQITLPSAKLLLLKMIQDPKLSLEPIDDLIDKFDLGKPEGVSDLDMDEAIQEICHEIIQNNPDVVKKIRNGQKNSMKFLVGLAMRETQGKVDARVFGEKFKSLLVD